MRNFVMVVFLVFVATVSRVSGNESLSSSVTTTNARPIRLAIGGFFSLDDSDALKNQSAVLTDILTAQLSQSGRFQLVERQLIDAVTREMSLSLSQVSNAAEGIRAGKLLRADWLLFGSWLNNGGTNMLVARIVDAQTGIIRDLAAIPVGETNLADTSAEIVAFVVNSADRVSRTEQRIFLGIGGFEDIGINNRYPDFRKNLRASLESTYRGTRFAVVERSMVNSLLGELRLNLGGLTEDGLREASAQPSFLLVDGVYQSFHDDTAKINLILRVQEIGGGQHLYSLKEPPGKGLDQKIITILDGALADLRQSNFRQTQKAEAAIQLSRGKELGHFQSVDDNYYHLGGYPPSDAESDKQNRLRNITQAIEAFESALLMDPENAEARIHLAICLLDPQITKKEAARDYLNEVVAISTNVASVVMARRQLARSYFRENDRHALDLLLALDRDFEHPAKHMQVQEEVLKSARLLRESGQLSPVEGLRVAEQYYVAYCESLKCSNCFRMWMPHPSLATAKLDLFVYLGQLDAKSVETECQKFLPQVLGTYPDLSPLIWASYTLWRSDASNELRSPVPTNILASLQASLELARDQPEKVSILGRFNLGFIPVLLEWCLTHENYRIGVIVAELLEQAVAREGVENSPFAAESFYYAGYCWRAAGKWQRALEAFETAEKQSPTFVMEAEGPWGKKHARVNAGDLVAECRQHLGLPGQNVPEKHSPVEPIQAPAKFVLGEPLLTLGQPTVFACDGDHIWLTDGYAPFVYNTLDQSLTDLDWPTNIEADVTCIRVEKNTVWWGTHGSGLVEMDKQTRRCKIYSESEGLLLPSISTLALSQDRLWIGFGRSDFKGFGRNDVGGFGYLDLLSRRFIGVTPELGLKVLTNRYLPSVPSYSDAPRAKVFAVLPTPTGDLWLLAGDIGLRYYSAGGKQWNNFGNRFLSGYSCMAVGSNYVAVGGESYVRGVGSASGITIHTISNKHPTEVNLRDCLEMDKSLKPPTSGFSVYCMALDGEKVWVGGRGFLALVDLKSARVEKFCNFDSRWALSAKGMEIEGDYLWVAVQNKLYRVPRLTSI